MGNTPTQLLVDLGIAARLAERIATNVAALGDQLTTEQITAAKASLADIVTHTTAIGGVLDAAPGGE
jgi:hypothetical protein